MKTEIKPLIVMLALALLFMSTGLHVSAQSDIGGGIFSAGQKEPEGNELNGVPGGPGFIMIHPMAFFPLNTNGERAVGYGGALYNPGPVEELYGTALNLPHGATISKIVVYFTDNSPETLQIRMGTINPEVVYETVIGEVTSTGEDPNPRVLEDTSILMNVVDNQNFGYILVVSLPGGQGMNINLGGVRIDYSYPVNLPLIKK